MNPEDDRVLEALGQAAAAGELGGVPGGMITGFTCLVTFVDGDGEPGWGVVLAPEQRVSDTAGHVTMLDEHVRARVRETIHDPED